MEMAVRSATAGVNGMIGTLAGIARHARPGAAMDVIERALVTVDGGIAGDFRGSINRGAGGGAR